MFTVLLPLMILLVLPLMFALFYGIDTKKEGLHKLVFFFVVYAIICSGPALYLSWQISSVGRWTARSFYIDWPIFFRMFFYYILIGFILFLIGQFVHFLKDKLSGD
jgi:hypothetical protein